MRVNDSLWPSGVVLMPPGPRLTPALSRSLLAWAILVVTQAFPVLTADVLNHLPNPSGLNPTPFAGTLFPQTAFLIMVSRSSAMLIALRTLLSPSGFLVVFATRNTTVGRGHQ